MHNNSEYDHFVKTLQLYGNLKWLNTYLDTLQRLLLSLHIDSSCPQLAMNVTKNHQLNSNISQRWVSRPYGHNLIGLLLPLDTDERRLNCSLEFFFTKNRKPEVKWVLYDLKPGKGLPETLYRQWELACAAELKRTKKSSFRRFHSRLFYDTVMDYELRQQILHNTFQK